MALRAFSALNNFHHLTGPDGPAARVARLQDQAILGPGHFARQALAGNQQRWARVGREASTVARVAAGYESAGSVSVAAAKAQQLTGLQVDPLRTSQRSAAHRYLSDFEWRTPGAKHHSSDGAFSASRAKRTREAFVRQQLNRATAQVRTAGIAPYAFAPSLRADQRKELEQVRQVLKGMWHFAPDAAHLQRQSHDLLRQVERVLKSDATARREAARLAAQKLSWPDPLGARQLVDWSSVSRTLERGALGLTSDRRSAWPSGYPDATARGIRSAASWQAANPLGDKQLQALFRAQTELRRAAPQAVAHGIWTPTQPIDPPTGLPPLDGPDDAPSEQDRAATAVAALVVWVHALRQGPTSAHETGRLVVAKTGDLLAQLNESVEQNAEVAQEWVVEDVLWAARARREMMPLLNFEERAALRKQVRATSTAWVGFIAAVVLGNALIESQGWYLSVLLARNALVDLYEHLGVLAHKHGREELVPKWYRS